MKTKTRVLVTTKLLAVALTATAGCAPTTGAPPASTGADHVEIAPVSASVQGSSAAPPAPQAAAELNTPSTAAPTALPASPPQSVPQSAAGLAPGSPSPADNAALVALRSELDRAGHEAAMARVAHFRPLCDKDGYPLVGNLVRKVPSYGPTKFCASVRDRTAAR